MQAPELRSTVTPLAKNPRIGKDYIRKSNSVRIAQAPNEEVREELRTHWTEGKASPLNANKMITRPQLYELIQYILILLFQFWQPILGVLTPRAGPSTGGTHVILKVRLSVEPDVNTRVCAFGRGMQIISQDFSFVINKGDFEYTCTCLCVYAGC